MLPGMRSSGVASRRGVVLAVAALFAVAVAAARGGSAIPSGPEALWGFDPEPAPAPAASESLADSDSILDVIGGVGTGLLLAAVGLLVLIGAAGVLASFGLREARRRRRAPTPVRGPAPDGAADDPAQALRTAVRTGAAEVAARPSGPPGDDVIAAWLVLEDAAASCGTRRAPAETASEFTARVLTDHAVDPHALADLRSRYHRARFAGEATPADAAAARAALARIEGTLGGARS